MLPKDPIRQIVLHLINFTFMFSSFKVKFIRKINGSNSNRILENQAWSLNIVEYVGLISLETFISKYLNCLGLEK